MNTSILKKGIIFMSRHADLLCTCSALVGLCATTYLSSKAAIKSSREIDEVCYDVMVETEADYMEDLPAKEKVKLTWKNYIPTSIAFTITVLNIIGSYHAGRVNYLSALAAYNSLENAVKPKEASKDETPGVLERKTFRVYEPYTSQTFTTTPEEWTWAKMRINELLQFNSVVTLNQFLMMFKNAKCYPVGEDLGWSDDSEMWCEDGYSFRGGMPWIMFTSAPSRSSGRNTYEISYNVPPWALHSVI